MRPAQRAATPGWETRTTVAETPRPAPAAPTVAEVRAEPPAGRMSIGATNVPPPVPTAAVSADGEPKPKRAGIVLKPRETGPDAKVAALPPAEKPIAVGDTARPPIGAVEAVDQTQAKTPPRPVAAPTAAAPVPTIVYRPPPQRYVTSYTPPAYTAPAYRERQRFGPQIFKELERNSR